MNLRAWPLVALALLGACGGGSPTAPAARRACGAYPPWQQSEYLLPYPQGTAHLLIQGNCSGASHEDTLRFAYDFEMPIGTLVTAARGGTVVFVEESYDDGDPEFWHSNVVQIDHGDGTTATYAHLTRDGALVEVGEAVEAGRPIALSGNTGFTLGVPHLHLDVAPCPPGGPAAPCPPPSATPSPTPRACSRVWSTPPTRRTDPLSDAMEKTPLLALAALAIRPARRPRRPGRAGPVPRARRPDDLEPHALVPDRPPPVPRAAVRSSTARTT